MSAPTRSRPDHRRPRHAAWRAWRSIRSRFRAASRSGPPGRARPPATNAARDHRSRRTVRSPDLRQAAARCQNPRSPRPQPTDRRRGPRGIPIGLFLAFLAAARARASSRLAAPHPNAAPSPAAPGPLRHLGPEAPHPRGRDSLPRRGAAAQGRSAKQRVPPAERLAEFGAPWLAALRGYGQSSNGHPSMLPVPSTQVPAMPIVRAGASGPRSRVKRAERGHESRYRGARHADRVAPAVGIER